MPDAAYSPEGYRPVSVAAALSIAQAFAKNVVVVVTYDAQFNRMHYTSFGVSAADKVEAARLADRIQLFLHGPDVVPKASADFRRHPFLELVAGERVRQRTGENFSDCNDDEYTAGQLAAAAACYAAPFPTANLKRSGNFLSTFSLWPWNSQWTKEAKEHDRRRQLVNAAALLCAEWDRLERAVTKSEAT